ncbi:MAG: hypothetical protein NW224_14045 [Leptolyngbyaceae cyanobacterium bins.302]|nr:hypothetical protein [Leptolyngbyaceae cyanobacterium bins.302]
MTTHNTLELAKQGDPSAIAVILTYHLSQRFNTSASAIRLGNYLSVLIDTSLIDTSSTTEREKLVNLVLSILRDLKIEGVTVLEIGVRQIGDRKVQWSQTIELEDSPIPTDMTETVMTESMNPGAIEQAPALESSPPQPAAPATSDPEWEATLKTLVQRPEMVALVAFALILVLWDTYLEWMEALDPTEPLTGVRLARRLGISASTLSRFKERANFSQWSQDLDPDGIAWSYENKVFVPRLN